MSTPWQPQPKMQSHDDSRKVTSISQRRPSSFGSSNETHSRVGPFGTFGMRVASDSEPVNVRA